MTRITWSGNKEAQRQSDKAYSLLKDKRPKKASRKSRRRKKRKQIDKIAVREPQPCIKGKRETTREFYKRYMKSAAWQKTRRFAFVKLGRRCQDCGRNERLEIHHRCYSRLGCEEIEDLEVLCNDCHSTRHDGHSDRGVDYVTKRYIEFMNEM